MSQHSYVILCLEVLIRSKFWSEGPRFRHILQTKTQCLNRKNIAVEGVIWGHFVAPLRLRFRNVCDKKNDCFLLIQPNGEIKESLLLEITAENFSLRFGFTYAFEILRQTSKKFRENVPAMFPFLTLLWFANDVFPVFNLIL